MENNIIMTLPTHTYYNARKKQVKKVVGKVKIIWEHTCTCKNILKLKKSNIVIQKKKYVHLNMIFL